MSVNVIERLIWKLLKHVGCLEITSVDEWMAKTLPKPPPNALSPVDIHIEEMKDTIERQGEAQATTMPGERIVIECTGRSSRKHVVKTYFGQWRFIALSQTLHTEQDGTIYNAEDTEPD